MILRAVGDYKDTFDAATGKITRNVGVKVLDGTEEWNIVSTNYADGTHRIYTNGFGYEDTNGISSHFVEGPLADRDLPTGQQGKMYHSGASFHLRATQFTSLGVAKQWLADQYAAGTPVTVYYPLAEPVVEDWDGGATYCESGIKIATNLYNSAKFQNVIDALDTAVSTINTIVAGTIAQANSIGELASGKQTRPNPADSSDETCPTSCPNYRQCLLVEKDDGTPCWYEILDPFYNLFTPVIANDTNAASTTAQNASGLPAGYTRLEYIQSSGTQYIDTNISPDTNTFYKLEVEFASRGTGYRFFGTGNNGVMAGFGASTNAFYINGGDTAVVDDISSLFNQKMIINYAGTNVNVNGTDYTCEQAMATSTNMYINARADSLDTRVGAGKWYRVQIGRGTTLQGDFIPAKRNSDNVLGMYDLVSGQFFTNQGTGTFTAGPVVSSSLETVWTATFAANANNNIPAGTVYGTAICNATSGTTNTAATAAQMSANNWTASGNYCWCRVTSVNTGGTSGAPSSEIWVYDGTSATCDSDCVGTCATSVGTGANKNFRRAISGLN